MKWQRTECPRCGLKPKARECPCPGCPGTVQDCRCVVLRYDRGAPQVAPRYCLRCTRLQCSTTRALCAGDAPVHPPPRAV